MERILPIVGMLLLIGFIGFLPFLGNNAMTGHAVREKEFTVTSRTTMNVKNCISDAYNPMQKGHVVFYDGKDYRWDDECLSKNRFLEYSCDGEDQLIITEGLCKNGCENGHCI